MGGAENIILQHRPLTYAPALKQESRSKLNSARLTEVKEKP